MQNNKHSLGLFNNYLHDNNIRQKEMAVKIGVAENTISRICRGTGSPSLETAKRISVETKGIVPIDSWWVGLYILFLLTAYTK